MITERLQFIASRDPETIALIDGATEVTYGDLVERSESFAQFLSGELGVNRGDVVGFFLPNCWQFVVAFFAVAKLGAVCMPLNTRWRATELRWYIDRFPINALLTNLEFDLRWQDLGDVVAPERRIIVDESESVEQFYNRRTASIDDSHRTQSGGDIGVHLVTSGSTGRPRVAPRSQEAMLAGAMNVGEAVGVRAGQSLLAVVPFYHANGFSNCLLLPLLHGATVALMGSFDPVRFTKIVRERQISILVVSPFILRILADRNVDADVFASVEVCLSSGAPTPPELAELWSDRFGIRVRQLYGSSETGTISVETADAAIRGGAVGLTVPNVEVRVLDEHDRVCDEGEIGDIVVKSPAMSRGYLRERELNALAYTDGYFRTGDLGRLDRDGTLAVVGRKKKTINFGGIKVDPAEIEAVIGAMPGVRKCRVMGVLDRRQSEIIKAIIAVGTERRYSRRDVVAHCRESIADYKIPRVIEWVDEIPVDVTGKTALAWGPN